MRQLDKDDSKPLGPAIQKRVEEEKNKLPRPVEGKPWLLRDDKGNLSTNIPKKE